MRGSGAHRARDRARLARGSRRRGARRARRARAPRRRGRRRQDPPGRGARGGDATRCVLRGAASPAATPPYGPLVAALRGYLRARPARWPRAAARCARTSRCCCPSSGRAVAESDRATLFEAVRCALATIAAGAPARVLLDDLQWSDEATLELLAGARRAAARAAVLVVGAYRSDELPRDHPLRGLRNELRRGRALRELALEPLDADGTAALAAQRPRRRRRRPRSRARSTTARRACRSSSRSSPARCSPAAG